MVGREGGWSARSQASGLMALTFSLFFIFRISALKKQESNDSTHQEELIRVHKSLYRFGVSMVGTAEPSQRCTTDPTNLDTSK